MIEDGQDAKGNDKGHRRVQAAGGQQIGMVVKGQLLQQLGRSLFGQVGAQQHRDKDGRRNRVLPGVDQVDAAQSKQNKD